MSNQQHLANIVDLLEAENWLAELVKRIAMHSKEEGPNKFAEDIKGIRTIFDEAISDYKFEMERALRLSVKHPELFKDPIETLKIYGFKNQ